MRKALVALPDDIWDIIDRDMQGKVGNGYSDIIRAIVLNWMAEKGYLTQSATYEIVRARLKEEGWMEPAKKKK